MSAALYDVMFKMQDMLTPGLKNIQTQLAKTESMLGSADKKISNGFDGAKGKLSQFHAKNVEMINGLSNQFPALGGAINLLSNPYVALGAAVATVGAASYKLASDWEKGMAKVNVTAQLSKNALANVSDQVLSIAGRSSSEFSKVPEAFNRIISAGQDVPTALKTLEPTLMAAKAGFADVETTAAAAVATMNSSGIQDATRVYDILFATLNKGNVEFNDIAQYLPKVMVGARAAGHSLEEVGGGFAILTANGFSAEQAATGLQNVFKALSDNDIIHGSKKYKGLEGIGVAVYDAAGKALPMINVMEQLKSKLNGLTDQQKTDLLGSIGFDMEASNAINSMTQNLDSFKTTQEFVTKSQGQLGMAFNNSKTSGDAWIQILNKLKEGGVRLGQYMLPVVQKIGEGFLWVIEKVQGLWEMLAPVRELIMGFYSGIASAVQSLAPVWNAAWEVMMTPIRAMIWAIQKIIDGYKWLSDNLGGGAMNSAVEQLVAKDSRAKQIKDMIDSGKGAEVQGYIAANFKGEQATQMQAVADYLSKGKNQGQADTAAPTDTTGSLPAAPSGSFAPMGLGMDTKTGKSAFSDGGGGGGSGKVQTITITINKLVGIETAEISGGKQALSDMETSVKEVLVKAIRDTELMAGQ